MVIPKRKFLHPWENREVISANSLRLLSLPENIIMHLKEGKLTSGHARALVGVKNSEFLARKIIEESLSVRDIENIVKKGISRSDIY